MGPGPCATGSGSHSAWTEPPLRRASHRPQHRTSHLATLQERRTARVVARGVVRPHTPRCKLNRSTPKPRLRTPPPNAAPAPRARVLHAAPATPNVRPHVPTAPCAAPTHTAPNALALRHRTAPSTHVPGINVKQTRQALVRAHRQQALAVRSDSAARAALAPSVRSVPIACMGRCVLRGAIPHRCHTPAARSRSAQGACASLPLVPRHRRGPNAHDGRVHQQRSVQVRVILSRGKDSYAHALPSALSPLPCIVSLSGCPRLWRAEAQQQAAPASWRLRRRCRRRGHKECPWTTQCAGGVHSIAIFVSPTFGKPSRQSKSRMYTR
jgi:hypothetical protein